MFNKLTVGNNYNTATKTAIAFFAIFYIVGITGLAASKTYGIFTRLIPFTLLLSTFGAILFHADHKDSKFYKILIYICLSGYIIEVIGVNSGIIFGHYSYLSALGFKVYNTPVIIGLNWFLLTYTAASLSNLLGIRGSTQILTGVAFMVLYDFLVEPVASFMQMWEWQYGIIPLQNYAAWFIIALLMQTMVKSVMPQRTNLVAAMLFVLQFVFFAVINLISNLK